MQTITEKNSLLNSRDPESIGQWLLAGMQEWDNYDHPWIDAFAPIALYDDLYLERQLVKYFIDTGQESIEHLINGMLWALDEWSRSDEYSDLALKGLLKHGCGNQTNVPFYRCPMEINDWNV